MCELAHVRSLRCSLCAACCRAQDEDTPTVTFPDDYPNSVRHFLLIGFLGMFIGAIVFFYMGISRKVNTVMHVLTFFIAAVSACAYYAEWAGLGVEYKTTDTTPRVIFWAHYLDWVVTGPVRSCPRACMRAGPKGRKFPNCIEKGGKGSCGGAERRPGAWSASTSAGFGQ
jgi:hypothetical protein